MIISSTDYKGYQIEIIPDENPLHPREDIDNLGLMVCFHRHYKIGDKHQYTADQAKEMAGSNAYISLPIYLYDHSGLTIRTYPFSCPWDSDQIGWILVEKERVRKEYGWKLINRKREKKIKEILQSEIEYYDKYLTNSIFGFLIRQNGEIINICYGFDDENYIIEYAKTTIDSFIKDKEKRLSSILVNF